MFRRAALLLMFGTLLSAQSIAQTDSVLEDGTPVKLRIGRTVSSADAQVGDTVDFEVLEEIKVGDAIVIPKSASAWATVTGAQSKRRIARGGKLDINLDSVRLMNGRKAALRGAKNVEGASNTGLMTGMIVGGAIMFGPGSAALLLMKGKDITVPKGTEITAYINGDYAFERAKMTPPHDAVPTVTAATCDKNHIQECWWPHN
jgi:hypothetical protein